MFSLNLKSQKDNPGNKPVFSEMVVRQLYSSLVLIIFSINAFLHCFIQEQSSNGGIIASVNYPKNYDNNRKDRWIINSLSGSVRIDKNVFCLSFWWRMLSRVTDILWI